MLKNGHRLKYSVNPKKLASYLNDSDVRMYATEDQILLADHFACFLVDYHKDLTQYVPPEKNKDYEAAGGGIEECFKYSIAKFWKEHIEKEHSRVLSATNYFYQPEEKILVRKFTDGEYTIWVNKVLTDLLAPLALGLDYHYQFEQIYSPADPNWIFPLRISFRPTLSADWKLIALFAPWSLKGV